MQQELACGYSRLSSKLNYHSYIANRATAAGFETLTGFVLDDDTGTYTVWVCADQVSGLDS